MDPTLADETIITTGYGNTFLDFFCKYRTSIIILFLVFGPIFLGSVIYWCHKYFKASRLEPKQIEDIEAGLTPRRSILTTFADWYDDIRVYILSKKAKRELHKQAVLRMKQAENWSTQLEKNFSNARDIGDPWAKLRCSPAFAENLPLSLELFAPADWVHVPSPVIIREMFPILPHIVITPSPDLSYEANAEEPMPSIARETNLLAPPIADEDGYDSDVSFYTAESTSSFYSCDSTASSLLSSLTEDDEPQTPPLIPPGIPIPDNRASFVLFEASDNAFGDEETECHKN